MGKSSSCLKMIACGSNTAAAESDDDHHLEIHHHTLTAPPQTKASGDKHGWSFRKKSGRHRDLVNNVSSKATTFADKEAPQVVSTDFQSPVKPTNTDEKPQLPEPVGKIGEESASEYDGDSKTSVEVIASQNDCSLACEKTKVSDVLLASEDTNSTSTEADDTVVTRENGNLGPSADTEATKYAKAKAHSPRSSPDFHDKVVNSKTITESVDVSQAESKQVTEPTTLNSVGASEDGSESSVMLDEPVAIIVQTSIRGFLAQQELLQLKNVVTLQAVIRGHLVRRNAVETLHCIQGITKVQDLVRARSSKPLDQNNKKSEGQFSTAALLKNSFARQLLESTPKPKSVNIRCDPLSPNSAWGWLERWMSVSSEIPRKAEPSEELKIGNQVQPYCSQADVELSPTSLSEPSDTQFSMDVMTKSSEIEENHGNNAFNSFVSQSSFPISEEKPQSLYMEEEISENVSSIKLDDLASVISVSQVGPVSLVDEAAVEIQQPKLSAKRSASEELNGEGKKLSCGSRKASNSSITDAQSESEALNSAAVPDRSISVPHVEDRAANSAESADTCSFPEETHSKPSELSVVGVDGPSDPLVVVAESECGTELSVTSTLDSPDRSELENAQSEPEVKILETSVDVEGSKEGQDCEHNGMSSNHIYNLASEITQQEEIHEIDGGVSAGAVVADSSPRVEQKSEMNATDAPTYFDCVSAGIDGNAAVIEHKDDITEQEVCLEHVTGNQGERLSPEASPRNRMSVPESLGTPSSQVSIKDKRNKIGKSGSNTKRSSPSAGKRSPSNPNLDSGARSSTEHLAKEHKSGKRRNSFGSTKSEADQEPRDSNSHSSVPSYMQATKSAKAKAHSPRSSPDVHDKEVNSKKRQSLPGVVGRQGSPRVQRATPEVTQGAKANGSHPSNERKWQR